jgi:Domain of unknown function (DUF4190)
VTTPAAPPPAPPPPPVGWQQPYQGQTRPSTSGFAVASLVLGLAFCTGIIGGILAVVFGNLALARIDASPATQKGRGLAIAGIVLGWIWITLTAVAAGAWLAYGISNL